MCDPSNPVLPTCPNTTRICQTTGSMATPGTPCRFPFTYNNTVYRACTTQDSPTGAAWCATQDSFSQGAWGFCNCSLDTNGNTTCATMGSMALLGSSCRFPFTLGGRTYSDCAAVGPGGQPICATGDSFADGGWGVCSCHNITYDPQVCSLSAPNGTLSGPSSAVQVALMIVANNVRCKPATVPDMNAGSIVQAFSAFLPIRLNYSSPEGDAADFVIVDLPQRGILDLTRISSGLVRYQIKSTEQFFYGTDTFTYRADQNGLTLDGLLSPCLPLQSRLARVTINITNLYDAPVFLLDVTAQPTSTLADRYSNSSSGRYIYDVDIFEDQPFDILLTVQVLPHRCFYLIQRLCDCCLYSGWGCLFISCFCFAIANA